jgi:hypothetical protein
LTLHAATAYTPPSSQSHDRLTPKLDRYSEARKTTYRSLQMCVEDGNSRRPRDIRRSGAIRKTS